MEKILTRVEFEALREFTPADNYAPDWQVYRVTDLGTSERYRFRVEGFNLNVDPGHMDYRFCWRVPALSWRYFMGAHYWSVSVPYSDKPTKWHCTDTAGQWAYATLSRGAFQTEGEAHQWALDNLQGQPYYLRAYQAAEYADTANHDGECMRCGAMHSKGECP